MILGGPPGERLRERILAAVPPADDAARARVAAALVLASPEAQLH